MKHLLTAYLAVTLIVAAASLLVLAMANRRLRDRALSQYTVICACLAVSVLQNLLLFYLGINVSDRLSPWAFAVLVASIPFSFVMQALIPILAHRILGLPWKRTGDWIAIGLTAILFILEAIPGLGIGYSPATGLISFGPAAVAANLSLLPFIGYSLTIVIIFRRRLGPELRRMTRPFIIVLVLSIPGLIHDQTYFASHPGEGTIPVTIIFYPLFFLAISILNIVYGARYVGRLLSSGAAEGGKAAGGPGPDPAGRLEALAESHSLSEREKEVALLVLEGLGNKQIAARLSISAKTVNNHVYNLFQKLGINSRFELMAMLALAPDQPRWGG